MTTNFHDFSETIKKIGRFYAIGIFALLGNTCITYLISDIWNKSYNFALFIVFLFNITIIFLLQRTLTFRGGHRKSLGKEFLQFIFLVLFLMVCSYFGVPFLNMYLDSYSISSFIIALFVTLLNYTIQNYLIFKK